MWNQTTFCSSFGLTWDNHNFLFANQEENTSNSSRNQILWAAALLRAALPEWFQGLLWFSRFDHEPRCFLCFGMNIIQRKWNKPTEFLKHYIIYNCFDFVRWNHVCFLGTEDSDLRLNATSICCWASRLKVPKKQRRSILATQNDSEGMGKLLTFKHLICSAELAPKKKTTSLIL